MYDLKRKAKIRKYQSPILIISLAIISAILLTNLRLHGSAPSYGDTAQLLIILQNIHDGLGPYNPLLPSIVDFVWGQKFVTLSGEELCKSFFDAASYLPAQYNHFNFHTYLILYPLSVFLYAFDVREVVYFFNFLAFTSLLGIIAYIQFTLKDSKFLILLTLLTISLFPGWSQSIQGQPYVDRLYLPFGLLLFYLLDKHNKIHWSWLAVVFISSLIVEKAIIYNAIFIVSYSLSTLFLERSRYKKYLSITAIGIILSIIFYIISKYYINNPSYSSTIPRTFSDILNNLKYPGFIERSSYLLLLCLPFFILPLLLTPKLALISLIMILPNILGNIGGAEKIGFATHYHSLYLPFIIYPFITSISILYKKNKVLIYIYLIISIILFSTLAIDEKHNIKAVVDFKSTYLFNIWNELDSDPLNEKIQNIVDLNIPHNASVSSIEAGSSYLYKNQKLHLFPMNFSKSEYLLLNYNNLNGIYYYSGYSGFTGENTNKLVNLCLDNKIKTLNFDYQNPIILNSSMAILRKVHP